MRGTSEERFWAKVRKSADGCWIWTGASNGSSVKHGNFRGPDGCNVKAHRYAYELLVGPIPEGLVLDHVVKRGCTSTLCVNPAHLEPVTQAENVRRGVQAQKTHCVHGHEYTPANTYISKEGWRRCRRCHADQVRSRRAARDDAG